MMRVAREILICAALALLCLFLWDLHEQVQSVNLAQTVQDYRSLALELKPTLSQLNDATASQLKAAAQLEQETEKTAVDLKTLIAHADWNLNGNPHLKIEGILPKTARSIDDLDALESRLTTSAADIDNLTPRIAPILTNLDDGTHSLAVTLASPAIPQSLNNISASSSNTARLTADASATMVDVKTAVHYEVTELTKPVSKVKAAFLFVLKAAGVFLGY